MRAALVLVVVAAAACGDDPGLRLEILAGKTGAVKIELYLGTRPCEGCDGRLAPAGVKEKLAGQVWYLDGSAAAGTPNSAASLEGGRYVYDLRAPDPEKDARIAHVIVVGYDAQGRVVGSAALADIPIYHAATEWYRVTLGTATGAPSSDAISPKGDRVYVWRRANPELAACVGYEQASDAGVERLWLVPEDDTDCDQLPGAECDAYAHMASGTVEIKDASCVTENFAVPGANLPSCLLGGPACIDGAGTTTTCGPVGPSHCLPDAICKRVGCAQNVELCLRDGQTNPVPRIKCNIPFNQQAGGIACAGEPQHHDTIDLRSLLAAPNSPGTALTTCKTILFAEPKLGMPNVQNKIAAGNIEIKPDPLAPPCTWGMTWVSGGVSSIGGGVAPIIRMTVVGLENGNTMLIPIEIAFHASSCAPTDVMTCDVLVPPTDGVTRCAQEP